jgi:hypothetical protein
MYTYQRKKKEKQHLPLEWIYSRQHLPLEWI